jgi:hypothetical protein
MRERSLHFVPKPVLYLLIACLCVQIFFSLWLPKPTARAEDLTSPPSTAVLKLISIGEPIALAKLAMLYLQAFDNQPGISIPFRQLDYNKATLWLMRILELDPQGQYPLFFASRLYGEVSDQTKQRQMAEFVYQQFLLDPNHRWPWLTHVTIMAKHRLKDLSLAVKYAHALREHATGKNVPHWAQQLEIFILEDMNELQSAKVLLGGLLDSGQITDQNELRFLSERLGEFEQKQKAKNN